MMKHIFQLFRHVMPCLMHLANNETAAIEIFPKAHQKKWRYIIYRIEHL